MQTSKPPLFRRIRRILCGTAAAWILCTVAAFAAEDTAAALTPSPLNAAYLVPVGRTAGVKIFADGVLVTELSQVMSAGVARTPARDAGLQPGDVITHVDGAAIASADELSRTMTERETVTLTVRRGEKTLSLSLRPCRDDSTDVTRMGAFVRDSIAGIGTITFYDPATGVFGALGHAICEGETGCAMPLGSGCLLPSTVTGVRRGESGTPGELVGALDLTGDAGSLHNNLETGLYGVLDDTSLYPELLNETPVEVGHADQVTAGPVEILANVSGTEVRRYQAEIVRVLDTDRPTRNLYLRITDPALLALTGGIVQGMSGSPILQNGRLIGAVTHVTVSDPTCGYGILIDHMLHDAWAAELRQAA